MAQGLYGWCSAGPGSPARTGGWEGIWGSLLLSLPLLLCWRAPMLREAWPPEVRRDPPVRRTSGGKMQPCFSRILCMLTENRRNINNHELLSV